MRYKARRRHVNVIVGLIFSLNSIACAWVLWTNDSNVHEWSAYRKQKRQTLRRHTFVNFCSNRNEEPPSEDKCKHSNLEEDIAKRLSISKDRAIFALSQPNSIRADIKDRRQTNEKVQNEQNRRVNQRRSTRGKSIGKGNEKAAGKATVEQRRALGNRARLNHSRGSSEFEGRSGWRNSKASKKQSPSIQQVKRQQPSKNNNSSTYSSLLPPPISTSADGEASNDPLSSGLSSWEEFLGFSGNTAQNKGAKKPSDPPTRTRVKQDKASTDKMPEKLPSIKDLFPPDLSSAASGEKDSDVVRTPSKQQQLKQPLEGVLPVSDLFYRSNQAQDGFSGEDVNLQTEIAGNKNYRFNILRNVSQQKSSKEEMMSRTSQPKKKGGRRMVRRGMEMLVGGVPINADPPHRSLELSFDSTASPEDWAAAITLNTLDFGPLLHGSSVSYLTPLERALFCEYFSYHALKWDICPKDLREIVKSRNLKIAHAKAESTTIGPQLERRTVNETQSRRSIEEVVRKLGLTHHDEEDDEYNEAMSVKVRARDALTDEEQRQLDGHSNIGEKQFFDATTELMFDLSVSKDELESGEGENGEVFKSVLLSAFRKVVGRDFSEFKVYISKLVLTDEGDYCTNVDVEFTISNKGIMTLSDVQHKLKRVSASFIQAVDGGDMQLAIAAAARQESRWSDDVRGHVIDECLFESEEDSDESNDDSLDETPDVRLFEEHNVAKHQMGSSDSLFIASGIDGIFPDFSESNAMNAPYHGDIGLRLVESVMQRAKERYPRVIAIGDVHGCIDELQDLLRQCDYRPGDLVVFLGDLVCKGPDSISVVQMAREIGAIGVRGNHDFEVIRWHQAIKSGVDPPVVGSEHFHIASCLSKADIKWMYSLPWFISSKELGSLFVHAGFVSGIRLAKQNPRLMMNMRSILPDGTVTSKFFNNWPWARLWDGPQTVLFGHDADRGLQQYEYAIGLDTGCVYGGRLTACILPEKRLVSVSARREYFKYRRKHYD